MPPFQNDDLFKIYDFIVNGTLAMTPFQNSDLEQIYAALVAGGGGGVPAGNDTEVQYNSAGVFGADPTFTYDPNRALSINGIINTGANFHNSSMGFRNLALRSDDFAATPAALINITTITMVGSMFCFLIGKYLVCSGTFDLQITAPAVATSFQLDFPAFPFSGIADEVTGFAICSAHAQTESMIIRGSSTATVVFTGVPTSIVGNKWKYHFVMQLT